MGSEQSSSRAEFKDFRRNFKPTCLAVVWSRTPASPLAGLMTGGTWMGRKATQEGIRVEKGLLESTEYDVSTQAPQSREVGARAVSLPALGKQGWAQVNLSTRGGATPPHHPLGS